jgi:hypothetical protein
MGSNPFAIILTFVHTFNDKSQKTAANAKHITEKRCKWLNSQNYYIPKVTEKSVLKDTEFLVVGF